MHTINATISKIKGKYGNQILFSCKDDKDNVIRMTSDDDTITVGEHREFTGTWGHYKSLQQFNVSHSRITPVSDHLVGMFLKNQTGIADKTVENLFKKHNGNVVELLENRDAHTLANARNVGIIVAHQAINAWHEQSGKTELIKYVDSVFKKSDANKNKFARIFRRAYEVYQEDTIEKINEDPYRIWAFSGWDDAEFLADTMGIDKDDRRRLMQAVVEAMYKLFHDGHTAPSLKMINASLSVLLDLDSDTNYKCSAIYEHYNQDYVTVERVKILEDGSWSLPAASDMESYVADELKRRLDEHEQEQQLTFFKADLDSYTLPDGNALDSSQLNAVNAVLKNNITVIIGEAGTGKTSCLFAANDLLHRSGRKVLQVALSGKAAQRLAQQTQQEAFTISSLLGKMKTSKKLVSKYDLPVLFIDEASMIDLSLTYRVLKAFQDKSLKIVFIGDPAQLPPIGPGLVFHELVKSDTFEVCNLETNYRTISGSTIPAAAKAIRNGIHFDSSKDVEIIDCQNKKIVQTTIDTYLASESSGSVQIISATLLMMRSLNRELQTIKTGSSLSVKALPEFCLGDPVIYKTNDKNLGLVNGSVGRVVSIEKTDVIEDNEHYLPADIVIDFSNEGRMPLLKSQVRDEENGTWHLQLAYSLTCHQAQGSEYDTVIIALEESRLLDRSWLYTAATRAKKKLIFIGDTNLIKTAIDFGNRADHRKVGINFDK